ncbi:MAG: chorismate mutase [Lachnospiraceae bacterium]|nr:chorismate mutase [Lachnospiraceae bacterium]
MDLKELRGRIDEIDEQIVRLFQKRMHVCADIADYKKQKGKAVFDSKREREKMNALVAMAEDDMKRDVFSLFSSIMDLSKSYQTRRIGRTDGIGKRITEAIGNTPKVFPEFPVVACQGTEGAHSMIACEKLFASPTIMYFNTFDAVFTAIEKGLCQYGILPIENSTAGSVNQVYDLMMKHRFSIVRAVRLKVDHSLLVKPGTKMQDIREVVSHEQAISQCDGFLGTMPGVRVTVCENTAVASKMVAESDRSDLAALASYVCADIYGLECLQENVQDSGHNYTRFICISKDLEIYPGADKTSIMAVTPHKPGALYRLLAHFYALGMNMTKLESRPLPDKNFEFMFYFDLEKSVYAPDFTATMDEIEAACERFEYLGSYYEEV